MVKVIKYIFFIVTIACWSFTGQTVGQDRSSILSSILDLDLEDANVSIMHLPREKQFRFLGMQYFLETLVSQNEATYNLFFDNTHQLIRELEELAGKDDYIYVSELFNISMYRAIIASQFSNYAQSARELIRSNRYYKKMVCQHPAHPASTRAAGLLNSVMEQIPDKYLPYTRLIGIDLPDQKGFDLLARSFHISRGQLNEERIISGLLWVIVLWEFHPDNNACWRAWEEVMMINPKLALVRYAGVISAIKSGRNAEALSILDQMYADGQFDTNPHLYYLLGKTHLFDMDSRSIRDFNNFLSKTKSTNYIKSAYLRMGWYYTLAGDQKGAQESFTKVINEGSSAVWSDQQAIREVKRQPLLNAELLRLRILFDGGYYEKCINASKELELKSGNMPAEDVVEVLYRMGRSYHAIGEIDKAMEVYSRILNNYRGVKNYQLPKIAIISAQVLADKGRNEQALDRIDLCLELNKYGYRSTFKRQAQALRRRIK